jgi:hypothetical protein
MKTLIIGGTLIDGTGAAAKQNASLRVVRERITGIWYGPQRPARIRVCRWATDRGRMSPDASELAIRKLRKHGVEVVSVT